MATLKIMFPSYREKEIKAPYRWMLRDRRYARIVRIYVDNTNPAYNDVAWGEVKVTIVMNDSKHLEWAWTSKSIFLDKMLKWYAYTGLQVFINGKEYQAWSVQSKNRSSYMALTEPFTNGGL